MGAEVCKSQSGKGAAVGRLKSDGIHSNDGFSVITVRFMMWYTPPSFLVGFSLTSGLFTGSSRSGVEDLVFP